jgi:uncharacterized FAD-dependent dehydrogenase
LGDVILVKRSLDARQRIKRWTANYRVALPEGAQAVLARQIKGVRAWNSRDDGRYGLVDPLPPRPHRFPKQLKPIIVGAGPAGLFAALRLAEVGAPGIVLERGSRVRERVKKVNGFWRGQTLDPESNVVYGEGGAGTFSDGKIYTRRRDGELGYIFHRLVSFGAERAALQEAWAHLGTDKVRAMLPRIRARLEELGVELRFDSRVGRFEVEGGHCIGVQLGDGSRILGGPVIVATGHSARDTYRSLLAAGAPACLRPISIGARIEHPQAFVDLDRYRGERGDLPPASYRLTTERGPDRGRGRPAHTFCMCPGGMVVPATNHGGRVVVNGMSFAARRAFWANSAVVVQVEPADYSGTDPLAGIRFQDDIERRAFEMGGGTYAAPAQRVQDLLKGKESRSLPRTSYPQGVVPCDLRDLFPEFIVDGLVRAVGIFEKRMPGFAGPEAVFVAPETRTSAPLRFTRGADLHSTGLRDLLPVGEGAGFAGGIVSAALDGLRAANSVIEQFGVRVSAD